MAKQAKETVLSESERAELETLVRKGTTPQRLAQRARIILLSTDGIQPKVIAVKVGLSETAVHKWRGRFREERVVGLRDRSRPGQPRKLSQAKEKEILKLTVERIPKESTHWSVRLMAKYGGITTWQVRQIWARADLKPHRLKTFKISNDPDFADKVVDIVGLYMDPPDNAMVLSVDEKTQIQALDRTQPMLPLKPGQVERRTHDYKRHGITNLYAAFDILTGEVQGRITKRHRASEFLDFLKQIDRSTDSQLDLHIILDNSSTHKTNDVRLWLENHPRFHLHFTPTSSSWLNAVEGWFAQLERRCLYRGIFGSVAELKAELRRYIKAHNQESAKPFRWTKDAKAIINSTNRAKANIDNLRN
jgi:transposase